MGLRELISANRRSVLIGGLLLVAVSSGSAIYQLATFNNAQTQPPLTGPSGPDKLDADVLPAGQFPDGRDIPDSEHPPTTQQQAQQDDPAPHRP